MQKADSEALSHYWQQQPELKEPEFLAILTKERKKQETDPTHRIMYLWELGIYRLPQIFHLKKEETGSSIVRLGIAG